MSSETSLDRVLHAIADPTRRRILLALKAPAASNTPWPKHIRGTCLCGGDIEERIHLSQPTISHHMAILTKANLVEAIKHGQWRWYKRNEKAIRQVIKMLRGKL